ncbi:MAG TPA: GNAT family N-acetyltransferase [Puia sp.]|jgi:ribosomal protein S18 acetylase RimI-like enzyme
MLTPTLVTTPDELSQIHRLNQANHRDHLSPEEKDKEGFVSWLYPVDLLQRLQELAPHVIVKDGDRVVGYALVALREAAPFHPDLQVMFTHLNSLRYKDRLLVDHTFYCMGQICVDKDYRGMGVVAKLYEHHRNVYSPRYDLLITEIATSNIRSQKAHEKAGFRTIFTYRDAMDEWNVVAWDWNAPQ